MLHSNSTTHRSSHICRDGIIGDLIWDVLSLYCPKTSKLNFILAGLLTYPLTGRLPEGSNLSGLVTDEFCRNHSSGSVRDSHPVPWTRTTPYGRVRTGINATHDSRTCGTARKFAAKLAKIRGISLKRSDFLKFQGNSKGLSFRGTKGEERGKREGGESGDKTVNQSYLTSSESCQGRTSHGDFS